MVQVVVQLLVLAYMALQYKWATTPEALVWDSRSSVGTRQKPRMTHWENFSGKWLVDMGSGSRVPKRTARVGCSKRSRPLEVLCWFLPMRTTVIACIHYAYNGI